MRAGGSFGDLLREIARTLAAYIRGEIIIALTMSALYAVAFGSLKVPAWPLMAVLCGFLHLVPNFGVLIGFVLAVGLTAIAGREFWRVAAVAGAFVLFQGFEGYYLTPHILGRRLGLRPFAVFLAVLAGSMLFGVVGLLTAAPALAIANVLWKFFRSRSSDSGRRPH
jgi:predicted PurR-regulated permease PerM